MTVSVPREKRYKYLKKVNLAIAHRKVSKKALRSLTGKLQHVAQVLTPGRPFIRRLIDRAHSVAKPWYMVDIRTGELEDLRWWKRTLSGWVGTKLLTYRDWRCEADCAGISEASGLGGFGLIVGRKWCAGEWTEEEKKLNICVLEIIPIVLAACIFRKEWCRRS